MQPRNSKYFCIAPWVHVCQNVGGRLKPCCRYFDPYEEQKTNDVNEYFNNGLLSSLRERISNGEYIQGCVKCYKEDEAQKSSYRNTLNNIYSDVDLSDPKIRYLEIGTSNACNFKCVTCASNYSTSWYDDDAELNNRGFEREHTNKSKFVITERQYLNVDLSNINKLKILGGEPFMEPRNVEILEKLDYHGLLSNLSLDLVTNASILPSDKWLPLLKKIKEISLIISIDGIDNVAEFVRHGTIWNRVEKNTIWWKEFCKEYNHTLQFHYVLHSFNCFDTTNMLEWAKEHHPDSLTNFDCLIWPNYINISYLPEWWKRSIRNNILKIDRVSNRSYALSFLNSNSYDPNIARKMLQYYDHLEDMRKTSLPTIYKTYFNKLRAELNNETAS